MQRLLPCPSCQRHVRASERRCPFCSNGLDFSQAKLAEPPRGRRVRGASLAFGASVVGALACADVNAGPVYGAPLLGTGGMGGATSTQGGSTSASGGTVSSGGSSAEAGDAGGGVGGD